MTSESPRPSAMLPLPAERVELLALRKTRLDRRLGYTGARRYVVFGYSMGGGAVFWKDGDSSGFGGQWRLFLEEVALLGIPHHVDLGGIDHVGTHVLLVDRLRAAYYAVPRASAEEFVALIDGRQPPTRLCLCAWPGERPPGSGAKGPP